MADAYTLNGRTAIVTGGGRGIGRAIALCLAAHGAKVVPASRTSAQVTAVAEEIKRRGGESLPVTADVSRPDEIKSLISQTKRAFGRIDTLVNAAGVSPVWKRIENISDEEWDLILNVNLKGAFLCCREAFPIMLQQLGGSIINVASVAGLRASTHIGAYAVSKAGLIGLTRALAHEWAKHNIRVNALAPGWVKTEMTQGVLSHEKISQTLLAQIPMKRFAEPEDMAELAAYLASDAANYVTGQVFIADGGLTA